MNPGGFPNQMPFMGMGGMPGANVISASPMITGKKVNNQSVNAPILNPTPTMQTMPNPILSGIFPGLIPGLIPGLGAPGTTGLQNPKSQQDNIDPALKKVFVKNVPPEVPDSFMESILKECGNIVQWKRSKNEKDIPMSFGTCEFENVEGVLRCLRIMNNLNILNEYLQIKPSDKTEKFLGEWSEMRMQEWSQQHKSNKQEDFEKYLQKDDGKSLERIHALIDSFDLNKIKLAKQKEEERKEHPRERERAQEKRDYERDMKRKFDKKLQDWYREEERMERERRREKDRERDIERDREKEKYRLLDKEFDFDSEEEKRRKANPKYQKQYEDRKKIRQKELEDDEEERRRELIAEEEKLRAIEKEKAAALDIEPPMMNILPESDSDDSDSDMSEEAPKPKQKKEPRLVFQPLDEEHRVADTRETSGQGKGFELNIGTKEKKRQTGAIQAEEDEEKPEENPHHSQLKKFKVSHKINQIVETKQNIVKIDSNRKEATITFGVSTLAPTAKTEENQKMLNELQGLISKIPKNKRDLFDFKVNWTLLAKSDLVEKKIKPWLCKQSEQYIGEQEIGFVNMILKKLANKESPQQILDKVKDLLDEDAEDFTMKLWRMLIFELLKLESLSNQ